MAASHRPRYRFSSAGSYLSTIISDSSFKPKDPLMLAAEDSRRHNLPYTHTSTHTHTHTHTHKHRCS